MSRLICVLISPICLVGLWPAPLAAAEEAAAGRPPALAGKSAEEIRQEVARLVEGLDSDHFHTRQEAASKLEELARQSESQEVVAAELARILVSADTSLEVRKQLESLQRELPDVPATTPGEISANELDRLMRQLEDDSYGERLSATRRLEWYLGEPKSVCRILVRLKERMSDARLSADTPVWLERMYERARAAWLLTDPSDWELPPVSPEQVARWIEDVAREVPPDAPPAVRRRVRTAKRELWDVLARDEYVPQVKEALEARLAEGELSREAAFRLQELLDITRPAMVAEYWEGHHHLGSQHLLVGVPSTNEGSIRPSHFDWINDETAHCVSGSNLSPGEYPVGVAIPHPNRDGAVFHLVNLPTPRRRMAYEYYARIDEAKRLEELSRRTLDRFLKRKEPLAREELILLAQLDFREVSRFAGRFVQVVDDQPMPPEEQPFLNQYLPGSSRLNRVMQRVGNGASRHGILAAILAAEGTREAIPGLLEAITAGRFLPQATQPPRRLEWIAALAIAHRDPWPEVDLWLGGLLPRAVPLVEDVEPAPDLGATAAGLLLQRHKQEPSQFGLEVVNDELLAEAGPTGYRFASEASRAKVAAWWAEHKTTAAGRAGAQGHAADR